MTYTEYLSQASKRCFECGQSVDGDARAWHGTISYCGDCAAAMGLGDDDDDPVAYEDYSDQPIPDDPVAIDAIAEALVTAGQSVVWVSARSSMAPVVLSIDGDHLLLTVDQAHAIGDALIAAVYQQRDTVIALEPLP